MRSLSTVPGSPLRREGGKVCPTSTHNGAPESRRVNTAGGNGEAGPTWRTGLSCQVVGTLVQAGTWAGPWRLGSRWWTVQGPGSESVSGSQRPAVCSGSKPGTEVVALSCWGPWPGRKAVGAAQWSPLHMTPRQKCYSPPGAYASPTSTSPHRQGWGRAQGHRSPRTSGFQEEPQVCWPGSVRDTLGIAVQVRSCTGTRCKDAQTHRHTGARVNGRSSTQLLRHTEAQTQMHRCMAHGHSGGQRQTHRCTECTGAWIYGTTDTHTHRYTGPRTHKHTDAQVCGYTDLRMYRHTDAQVPTRAGIRRHMAPVPSTLRSPGHAQMATIPGMEASGQTKQVLQRNPYHGQFNKPIAGQVLPGRLAGEGRGYSRSQGDNPSEKH